MPAWTARDHTEAQRISEALGDWQTNAIIGSYALAVRARLVVPHKSADENRRRLIHRVYHLAPLVAELVPAMYPGHRMHLKADGHGAVEYRLIQDTDPRAVRPALPRMRKAATAWRRAGYEMPGGHPLGAPLEASIRALETQMQSLITMAQYVNDEATRTALATEADTTL